MSDGPEVPPIKVCDVNLKGLALHYKDTTKTLKEIIEKPVAAATVTADAQDDMIVHEDDEIILPYDDNEGYNSRLEMLTDMVTKEFVKKGKPSDNVPEIVFSIPCIDPNHTVTNNLERGYFVIRGSSLGKLSVAQAILWADANLSHTGCGFADCTISLEDCLQDQIEGDIMCYKCKGNVLVDAMMACPDHPETKLVYLVTVALLHVTTWYTSCARKKLLKNVTLPFAVTPAVPGTQIFLTTVKNGLGLHPWVKTKSRSILCHLLKAPKLTEFARLVSVLSDFDQAGDQGMLDQVQVGPSGNVARRLLEDQKLQNRKRELALQNARLLGNKRKRDELSCNYENFRKRKLAEVGDRRPYEAIRTTHIDDRKQGGLKGGFSDISIRQSIYNVSFHANVGPKWKSEGEDEKVVTSVTRSWDDQWYCLECVGKNRHSIFSKRFFAIVIADQHFPSMVPAMNGVCICVIRHQDLSAAQLLTHTIWMLADAAESNVKPRSADEFGAASALQVAYEREKEIHIFLTSGTGLVSDQAAGTSYQMQRGLRLISDDKLGRGKSSLFKRLIFLQPAIPSIDFAKEDTSIKDKLAIYEIEMSNAARLLALNSCAGNYQVKTFLSATETVMVASLGEDKDELRLNMSFQCVTKLKNWSSPTQVGEMRKCHLSRWPAWPTEGRSRGNALTLNFLTQYCAAVMVDMLHSLSIEENSQDKSKKIERSTPKVKEMLAARVTVQNLVSDIQAWNLEANVTGDDDEYGCYNLVGHRSPELFRSIGKWRDHCVECYGHDKNKESWRQRK
jgi:hypothetical protein